MKTNSGPVTCLAIKASPCQAPLTKYREIMEKLLDIDDVSEMLGVTKATIYSWTSQNKIPHIKLSKRILKFREDEIKLWLTAKSVSTDTASPPEQFRKSDVSLSDPGDFIERIISNAKQEVLN